jgi:hypothetical protein
MGLGSATGAVSRVSRVSRTGAEVEPGLSRAEQKRRRVTWGKRCASVEVPVVLRNECSGICSRHKWFSVRLLASSPADAIGLLCCSRICDSPVVFNTDSEGNYLEYLDIRKALYAFLLSFKQKSTKLLVSRHIFKENKNGTIYQGRRDGG